MSAARKAATKPKSSAQTPPRPEDERPPLVSSIAYSSQHVLTMYGGIIAPPLIIGAAAGMDSNDIGLLTAA